MKKVFITTDIKLIDKSLWPKYVRDFVEDPDISSIHSERGSKLAYRKFNTEAYPRLVFIEEKDSDGNILYVLRKYFKNHDVYNEFRELTEARKLQKTKYSPLEKEEIEQEFSSFLAKETKEPLPKDMRDFENVRDFSNTATTYVFEMEEWCKHIRNKVHEEIFETIRKVVIDKETASDLENPGWSTVYSRYNKKIIFRVHENDSHTFYYLFDIGGDVDMKALTSKYIDLSNDKLLKQARKGYPDWILYGEFEDWKKLENDDEANLALSDEEVKVLNETPYPYFVNGLAGSGKSTILYYLFAHAYSYKEIKPIRLLFLSYSPKLIAKAKSVVKALLRTNPSYHGFNLTEEEERLLDACFCPFQEFLISNILNTDEEISYFSDSRHLSYEQFQKDYSQSCKLDEANYYKAAIVWSVIRTFIKGRDYNKPFALSDYNQLHKNDRTVTPIDYECIYKIWSNWYKPFYEGKRWDDLDLVSYVQKKMDTGMQFDRYDIIYCDEAQDFTPIENALILRLSKYTSYDLKGYDNIPIAYAGDPNQTVSPTGFNWKRLKEIFDNTFSELIGNHVSLAEKTLNNNYRSKRTIVEFANSLQYIRKCFLSDDVLQPQEQWNPQANPLPGFFFLTRNDGNEDDKQVIRAGFSKTECIITGAEGEYTRELDKDVLTEDSTQIDDELLESIDNKTRLYTALSSKGLEFKAVLLYRFADQLPKSFSKILKKEDLINESDRYELSHFFTKLYIAVSRAKEVLYIADTQENYESFWQYFVDNRFVNELLEGKQDAFTWKGKIGGIELGRKSEFLSRMAENFSPLETAQKIYDDAKLNQNAKDMNRAVGYFEEAGDFSMAEECKAYVLLYEKDYLKSGQKFLAINRIEDATKAFWQGCCWEELVQHSDRAIYTIISNFMTSKLPLTDLIQKENIVESFSYIDLTWKLVVVKIAECAKSVDSTMVFSVCEFLEKLAARGFVNLNPTIAELYYRNKQYAQAISKWDALAEVTNDKKYIENKSYYLAKEIQSDDVSEKIYWMHKGGKSSDILRQYSSPSEAPILDDRAKRIVFSLLLTPQTFTKAISYPYESGDKYSLLYKTDNVQFIEQYVLNDFTEEKFITWVERSVNNSEFGLFDRELPTSLFERIFDLPEMSDWVHFMKLKDAGGYRVIRNEVNVNRVADAICGVLSRRNYMHLGSCFLDVVFNNPYYNDKNANKYLDTLLKVFTRNNFSTRDFMLVSRKNKYFEACGLTVHDIDTIKDRLRNFVEAKLRSYKKVKQSDNDTIKTLLRIYEKVAPLTQDEENRPMYDADSVLSFYTKIKNEVPFNDEILKYIDVRKAVITLRFKETRKSLSKLEKLLPRMASFTDVVKSCDEEDNIWFINFIFGKSRVSEKNGNLWGRLLGRAIYEYGIYLNDFESPKFIQKNFIGYTDSVIEDLLSKDRIDIPSFKLHAYLYEVFLEETADKANKYNELSRLPRLAKLTSLVRYLRQRALHFYSYGSENRFKMYAAEFGESLTIDQARERVRPIIDELGPTSVNSGLTPPTISNPFSNAGKKEEKEPHSEKTRRSSRPQAISPEKKAQLDVARNLKKMCVDNAIILQACPLLTKVDLDKL